MRGRGSSHRDAFGRFTVRPAVPSPAAPAPAGPRDAQGRPLPARRPNPDAFASLLIAVCGVVLLPVFLSIPAIVLASRARRRMRPQAERPGWTQATVALWLGWLGVLWPLGLLVGALIGGGLGA